MQKADSYKLPRKHKKGRAMKHKGPLIGLLLSCAAVPAFAKVSTEQAKQLGGPVLTEFGAKKAGNADGSIPPYTGGLSGIPAGVGHITGLLPDPYASDKVSLTINASNVAQYADQLTPGTTELIKRIPTFQVEVYPTHRSMNYPKWILDNTIRNAVTAELVGVSEGDGVKGAYGGIPFPLPQNGAELLWDTVLRWQGVYGNIYMNSGIFVDANGHRTLTEASDTEFAYPYYDKSRTSLETGSIQQLSVNRERAPASQDGGIVIIHYPIDYGNNDQAIYTYTVGQRRIRLAPEFKYDTPVASAAGAFTYDEIDMWEGRPDRFDFKITGEKEMYVPYNNYKIEQSTVTEEQAFQAHNLNSDLLRWEKHRVWILDSTLRPGKRHIYSRRVFYVDEDSYAIVASDAYDQGGHLYRIGYDLSFPVYNAPEPFMFSTSFMFYNLDQRTYFWQGFLGSPYNGKVVAGEDIPPMGRFSPENVAGTGIR